MGSGKKKRTYTLYSLVRTILDEMVLAAVVLWLLPRFDINIPVPILVVFMLLWAVYSYLTSGLVEKVIDKSAAVGREALIGVKCTTTTPLLPDGYARVGPELWRARSVAGDVGIGVEMVIVGINRLTVLVEPSADTGCDEVNIQDKTSS